MEYTYAVRYKGGFYRYLPSGGTSRKIDFAHILLLEKALARSHTGFSYFFFQIRLPSVEKFLTARPLTSFLVPDHLFELSSSTFSTVCLCVFVSSFF